MRVFLVEDIVKVRDQLKNTVEEIGASIVGEAATEDEAIRQIVEVVPDVAIIDLRLLDGSGFSVIRKIKERFPKMLVIVLTNYHQELYYEQCKLNGADFYFKKGVDYLSLVALLKALQCIT